MEAGTGLMRLRKLVAAASKQKDHALPRLMKVLLFGKQNPAWYVWPPRLTPSDSQHHCW